jgi:hypothetical protein
MPEKTKATNTPSPVWQTAVNAATNTRVANLKSAKNCIVRYETSGISVFAGIVEPKYICCNL